MQRKINELRPTSVEQSIEWAALLANSIPTIGGLLSGIVMNATSARRWTRLLSFLESIEGRLQCVEELSEDKEEIVVEIVERVVRERSEEKIYCYRNILLNVLSSTAFEYDETLEMVRLVERLTANHIKVLQVFRDPVAAKAKLGSGGYVKRPERSIAGLPTSQLGLFLVSPYFPGWPENQLSRIWEDLCDAHVIERIAPQLNIPPSHDMIGMDFVEASLGQYISEYGHEFIRFVLTLEANQP